MKLVLKKNDSATSLLLFIFNTYYSKSNNTSLKLSALLEIVGVFGKSETATRMSLSRAVKSGLLINGKVDNEVYYSLTEQGLAAVNYWNNSVKNYFMRYRMRNMNWNNSWYFVNMETPGGNPSNHNDFVDELEQRGFASINTGTWVSPYDQKDEISKLIEQYDIKEKIIEVYGQMTIHKGMDKFVDEIYDPSKLRKEYEEFVASYKEKLVEVKERCQDQQFIEEGLAFPILHELGFRFFATASNDAVLPIQILPRWEGDEATDLMIELRSILIQAIHSYLNKFE